MKVGLVSDIHGNLPALEATFDLLDSHDVDHIYCTGDVVGVLGWNAECAARVRKTCHAVVVGNHDGRVLPDIDFEPDSEYEEIEHDLVTGQLADEQMDWLAGLAEKQEVAGGQVILVHSHPDPEVRWTGDDRVKPSEFVGMGAFTGGGVLCMGHTHDQHAVALDPFDGQEGLVVNPGSVGVPYYETADCAIVHLSDGEWDDEDFDLLTADYDAGRVVDRLESLDVYSDLQQIARSRRPVDRHTRF